MASMTLPDKARLVSSIIADVRLTPNQRLVAVALAVRFHNTKTGRCFPSYETLAKAVGLKRRAAIDAVRKLEQIGWVSVERSTGGRDRNWYSLQMAPGLGDEASGGDAPPRTGSVR
jgi:DNA-binding MarR family transcriptional regulator